MKRLLKTTLATLLMGLSLYSATLIASPIAKAGGQDSPFPLDFPLPFPWSSIEGMWSIESGDQEALFSFEVQNDCQNHQILKILEMDPRSGAVVARGIGNYISSTKQVYAIMGPTSGSADVYLLYVGLYKDTHVVPPRRVYGLRLTSFGDPNTYSDFRIHKVQGQPTSDDVAGYCSAPSPRPDRR
jgi:hypothetical protein